MARGSEVSEIALVLAVRRKLKKKFDIGLDASRLRAPDGGLAGFCWFWRGGIGVAGSRVAIWWWVSDFLGWRSCTVCLV